MAGSIQPAVGVSWRVAAFLLVNTALGAGMLNYPYAYNQIGGVAAAALIQVVLLVFIASTMFILVYCADINQNDSYHDVLMSMCGKRAQQISAFSIFLTCYGINVTFLVIIGDQYDRIFNSHFTKQQLDEYWFLDRKFTILITSILFIWPMCYAKRLDFLRHASILGLFAMLYVAFLTVYEHYMLDESTIQAIISHSTAAEHQKMATAGSAINKKPEMTTATSATISNPQTTSINWFEALAIVPVLCFAYQTHEVIVPVYACMRHRSIGHFMRASIFGLVILYLLYNLVGAFGYLTFGSNVGADIMSYYDANDPIVVVGIIALVIKFITTYPPLMFCGRGAFDGLYGEVRKLNPEEFNAGEPTRRIIISTLWFSTTVLLAVFAPDISFTLQLLGSMASINVFVFPGMCLVSLTRKLRKARFALLIEDFEPSQAFTHYHNQNNQQQRAKDYYLVSGRHYSTMRKYQRDLRATAVGNNYNQHILEKQQQLRDHQLLLRQQEPQYFAATFADLMDFEKQNSTSNYDNYLKRLNSNFEASQNNINYLTMSQRRQEEFERLIGNNGSYSSSYHQHQEQQQHSRNHRNNYYNSNSNSFSNHNHIAAYSNGYPTINDSHDDYSDCDERFNNCNSQQGNINNQCNNYHYKNNHHSNTTNRQQQQQQRTQCRCDMINPIFKSSNNNNSNNNGNSLTAKTNNNGFGSAGHCSGNCKLTPIFNDSKQQQQQQQQIDSSSLDKSAGFIDGSRSNKYQNYQNNSWNQNNSFGASILDRLGSSIAPSTVAQIGISKSTAIGLYLFSAIIILFGASIFTLEVVTVFGLIY